MREILFRGKRIDTGEWVFGSLWIDNWKDGIPCHIIDVEDYLVDPSTVGQYTGLTDVTGKKIFEGDVVSYHDDDGDHKGSVYYDSGQYWVSWPDGEETENIASLSYAVRYSDGGAIIGNIHDNRELIDNPFN